MIFPRYREKTEALYQAALRAKRPDPDLTRYGLPDGVNSLLRAIVSVETDVPPYNPDRDLSGVYGMTIRRQYEETIARGDDPRLEQLIERLTKVLRPLFPEPEVSDSFLTASAPLRECCNVQDAVRGLVRAFDGMQKVVPSIWNELHHNEEDARRPPERFRGTDEDCIRTYLANTLLADIFDVPVLMHISDALRTQHTWMVGSSGTGKTTALKWLIAQDFDRIAKGEASLILIDSQRELIEAIRSLKIFADGELLANRLVVIDPTDIEYPLALNIFSLGSSRLDKLEPVQREQMVNTAIELYSYMLDSLLGSELTAKQGTLFRYVVRLMMTIPDATIHTFADLFQADGKGKFAAHIARLPRTQRRFFETEFWGKEFASTRSQVLRRIWTVLENETLARMFSYPRSKLDIFEEMNSGNVILINADKALLRETGTEIFGRFFVALIAMAVQERAMLRHKIPCYVYIDECQDYFSGPESHLTTLLEQARKQNVGLLLAHQNLGQLPARTIESLSANTAIKLANTDSARDASQLAREMRCSPDHIMGQPTHHFACYARGSTRAMSVSFQVGHLERFDRMSDRRREAIRALMRQRYAVHVSEVDESAPTGEVVDLDNIPIDAAPE